MQIQSILFVSFLMTQLPSTSTLFPYTTLFRSERTIKKPPRFGGMKTYNWEGVNPDGYFLDKLEPIPSGLTPSQLYVFMQIGRAVQQESETDLVCRLLLEKKKNPKPRNPLQG